MRELRAAGAFVRGWEMLSHFWAMFRVASLRHLMISLVFSALASSLSIAGDPKAQRGYFLDYIRASAHSYVSPNKPIDMELPSNGKSPTLLAHEARAAYQDFYSGRTLSFIVRQWALRTSVFFLFLAPALAWLMVTFGKSMSKTKRIRGGQLLDLTTQKNQQAIFMLSALASAFVLGMMFVVCIRTLLDGHTNTFKSLLGYLIAKGASVSEVFAAILSPDWSGSTIWVADKDYAGFLSPSTAKTFYEMSMGQSAPRLFRGLFAGGSMVGLIAFSTLRFRAPGNQSKEEDLQNIDLGGVELPVQREPSSILVTGSIGSGKSVAIKSIADTIRARGQRAIVNDIKGDMTALYYRPGKDVILNPLDARCAPWTPWAEIRNRSDYTRVAKSLFPILPNTNPFFSIAGASLFASVTERFAELSNGRPSNQELAYALTQASIEEMQYITQGTAAARSMDSNSGDMTINLLATLSARLESLVWLPDVPTGQKPFSLRDFIEEESDRWLFISMRPQDQAVLSPLLACWYDLALDACLGLPDVDPSQPDRSQRRIFCILDELTRLGKLNALPGALREGRSKGLATVIGLQSIGDMRENYGRDRAEALLGQPQTSLVLRTVEPDTAKWLERLLGRSEKERTTESQSMGANSQRDGVNLSRQINTNALVLDAEIQTLPDLHGYLKVVGEPVKKVNYRWKDGGRYRNNPRLPGFIERPMMPPPRKPAWLEG